MMKKIKIYTVITFLILLNATVRAQIALPYYTGFDSPAEQAGWLLYKLGVNATYGPWTISTGGYSAPNCLYHDYNNTGTVEDWYVSPALNFTAQSKIALKIKAFSMTGSAESSDYIGIWYSSGGQNPNAGQYTEVVNLTSLTSSNSQWLDTTVNLPFTAGTGYIGLKYMNANNWFNISIDNINVTALTTSITEAEDEIDLLLFPNPSSEKVVIESTKNVSSVEIFSLSGQKTNTLIFRQSFSKEVRKTNTIDVSSLPHGVYLIKIYTATSVHTEKIIVR